MIIDRFLPHSNMTNVYTFTNFSSRNKAKKKVILFSGNRVRKFAKPLKFLVIYFSFLYCQHHASLASKDFDHTGEEKAHRLYLLLPGLALY